jgi:regulator of ribonuclease activity A
MTAPMIPTADLIDNFGDLCASCEAQFLRFGARSNFHGRIRTIKCYDDNVLIRRAFETRSEGEVMVVDGAGYLGSALIGDQMATLAIDNGWAGIVIFGALRDSVALSEMDISIKALGTNPKKSGKNSIGESDVTVTFGNVVFRPGEWIYSDEDGILVSTEDLLQRKSK